MKLDLKLNIEIQIQFDIDKLFFMHKEGKFSVKSVQNIYKFFTGKEIENPMYMIWAYHANCYHNNYERNKA